MKNFNYLMVESVSEVSNNETSTINEAINEIEFKPNCTVLSYLSSNRDATVTKLHVLQVATTNRCDKIGMFQSLINVAVSLFVVQKSVLLDANKLIEEQCGEQFKLDKVKLSDTLRKFLQKTNTIFVTDENGKIDTANMLVCDMDKLSKYPIVPQRSSDLGDKGKDSNNYLRKYCFAKAIVCAKTCNITNDVIAVFDRISGAKEIDIDTHIETPKDIVENANYSHDTPEIKAKRDAFMDGITKTPKAKESAKVG